jgi:hypothetical protein
MTIIDRGCWERGCACYDSRIADETVEVVEKRPWVGLTDEEIWTVLQFRGYNTDTIEIARAIEARLKERNT